MRIRAIAAANTKEERVKHMVLVAIFVVVGIGVSLAQSPSDKVIYTAPTDLELSLMPTPDAQTADGVSLSGKVEGRVGKLTGLEVWTTSSPDLAVETVKADPELASGATLALSLKVKPASEKHEGRPWVKLHVSYLPDYEALLTAVQSDADRYPDPTLRERLLAELQKQRQGGEKVSRVVGHLFITPPFGGK